MLSSINNWQAAYIVFALLSFLTTFDGWSQWHLLFKPLVMPIAIAAVLAHAKQRGQGVLRQDALLIGALAFSALGDSFLMFKGFFVWGLGSFLIAHVFFLALFKRGVPWFSNRLALLLLVGFTSSVYLWFVSASLTASLYVPVAIYVTVISLMCAQAIGRASTLGKASAQWVAIGAVMFVLSDLLIGIDKFVESLPLRHFWVLATYYIAQYLIVWGVLPRSSNS